MAQKTYKIPYFFKEASVQKMLLNRKVEHTKQPVNPRRVDGKLVRMRIGDMGFRVVRLVDIARFYGYTNRQMFNWIEKGYIPKPAYYMAVGKTRYAGLYLQYQGYYLVQALNMLHKQHERAQWSKNPEIVELLHRKCEASLNKFRLRVKRTGCLNVKELLDELALEGVAEILDD